VRERVGGPEAGVGVDGGVAVEGGVSVGTVVGIAVGVGGVGVVNGAGMQATSSDNGIKSQIQHLMVSFLRGVPCIDVLSGPESSPKDEHAAVLVSLSLDL